jgi:hypothetical protein
MLHEIDPWFVLFICIKLCIFGDIFVDLLVFSLPFIKQVTATNKTVSKQSQWED